MRHTLMNLVNTTLFEKYLDHAEYKQAQADLVVMYCPPDESANHYIRGKTMELPLEQLCQKPRRPHICTGNFRKLNKIKKKQTPRPGRSNLFKNQSKVQTKFKQTEEQSKLNKMISKSWAEVPSFLLYSCSQHSDLTNGWNVELNDHLICQTVATATLLIESGRRDFYT